MDYPEALSYMEALVALGVKVGLDHTRHLARRMGDPQLAYPTVLIGGTNGKGSTASFLSAILRAAGLRVGLYTSPHLVDIRERIEVGGERITPEAFAAGLSTVRGQAEAAVAAGELATPPTYFEALTLLAFEHFRAERVDLALLEVGLGGRLDCTNISEPLCSVVTNIGLDHEEILGEGLERIAREKAGIFRRGVPALTGAGAGLETLEACAREVGAPLEVLGGEDLARSSSGWSLSSGNRSADLPLPALPGEHQFRNAALAVRTAWVLRDAGFVISDSALRSGVAAARWEGRLERVTSSPDLYLDGAHNPDGCRALAAFVASLPHARKALVFAAMRDKPIATMLHSLAPPFGAVWATRLPMPRCMEPSEVRARAEGVAVSVEPDPIEAIRAARAWAGRDGLVVVSGSLYLVGYVKSLQGGSLSRSWGSGL